MLKQVLLNNASNNEEVRNVLNSMGEIKEVTLVSSVCVQVNANALAEEMQQNKCSVEFDHDEGEILNFFVSDNKHSYALRFIIPLN